MTGSSRSRGARGATGYAEPRQSWGSDLDLFNRFYPGYFDPYGYGSAFGYVTFDPWWSASSRWGWAGYSSWYDPFGYPFGTPYFGPGFGPYGHWYGTTYWQSPYSTGGGGASVDDGREMGSLRVRANPRHAKVYVDGALAGTVDDFDGLSDHLKLEAGTHQLELRAEGYASYTTEIDIDAGRTRTARASLKKTE